MNTPLVHHPQLWAYCYHIGLHVHHNLHLEAMHRVLKHVHMQGHKVKRSCASCGRKWLTGCRKFTKANGLSISVAFGCIIAVGVNACTERLVWNQKKVIQLLARVKYYTQYDRQTLYQMHWQHVHWYAMNAMHACTYLRWLLVPAHLFAKIGQSLDTVSKLMFFWDTM